MPRWFKGMEIIICERGLWPEDGLLTQCPHFHCPPGRTDCCCWRLLFTQPDFKNQKSQLQELIEERSHLCDFYPKYHCELNFIKQYWGTAKFRYHTAPRSTTIKEMEKMVKESLDDVPLLQIQRATIVPGVTLIASPELKNQSLLTVNLRTQYKQSIFLDMGGDTNSEHHMRSISSCPQFDHTNSATWIKYTESDHVRTLYEKYIKLNSESDHVRTLYEKYIELDPQTLTMSEHSMRSI
ncbi:hypothetical protein H4582DRAFT_2071545 [Lactarius indigo]|nr:hypothetical protein H4582DRAFT_2071545 [Lactarius indigo]